MLTGSSENAWSCSWHQERSLLCAEGPFVSRMGLAWQCFCTTQNLLPCTVADAGLLENEIIILAVAMISWSLKLRWGWGKVFPDYGKCNWFKLLHDCKFWYVRGVFVVIWHKEQSSSIRHKMLCLTVFEVLDSDTCVKYSGGEVGYRSLGAMSFKGRSPVWIPPPYFAL